MCCEHAQYVTMATEIAIPLSERQLENKQIVNSIMKLSEEQDQRRV